MICFVLTPFDCWMEKGENGSSFYCGLLTDSKDWGQNEWDVGGLDVGVNEKLIPSFWT